jgi:hypothetical protein
MSFVGLTTEDTENTEVRVTKSQCEKSTLVRSEVNGGVLL